MGAFEDVVRQLLDARGWCDSDGNHSDLVSVSCETLGRWYDELVRAHDMDTCESKAHDLENQVKIERLQRQLDDERIIRESLWSRELDELRACVGGKVPKDRHGTAIRIGDKFELSGHVCAVIGVGTFCGPYQGVFYNDPENRICWRRANAIEVMR